MPRLRLVLPCALLLLAACSDTLPTGTCPAATAAPSTALAGSSASYPDLVPLPDGFQPEGIATGRGSSAFIGGLFGGAIYRADLRTGEGSLLVAPDPDRSAVGIGYDTRSNLLFVCGGFFGNVYVYDATTGALEATYQLNTSTQPGLVNDVVITRAAAYFTDSYRPVLYRLPLGSAGALPAADQVQEIPLGGDYMMGPGAPLGVSANGIDATADGKALIVANTDLGTLYRIDPATGLATLIDLHGDAVPYGDGILLDGYDLYVAQNLLNQVAVIRLDSTLGSGNLTGTITDPAFRIPTAIDRFGNGLYAVNARFDVAPPTGPADPTIQYEVVRFSR